MTDQAMPSKDAWYETLDRVETEWGIYDPVEETFTVSAIAVELTTNTQNPWGQGFVFGDTWAATSLGEDAVIVAVRGRLRSNVIQYGTASAVVMAFDDISGVVTAGMLSGIESV